MITRGVTLAALALALGGLIGAPCATASEPSGNAPHGIVVERFGGDPLNGRGDLPFFVEGDAAARFTFVPGTRPRFAGDRPGSLRVLYDTTLPAARIATPLGTVVSLDENFQFGAVLTIRSEGLQAPADGFSQIAFGLWNAATTGINRAAFPSDSFDLVEFDYFPNVTAFGGPFLSPSIFGGRVGDNAFFNFTFVSREVGLPLDQPLLCHLRYDAASRMLHVTVGRGTGGLFFERIAGATVSVDLSIIHPTFLVDLLGIAGYFEGYPSLRAEVDYDLLYAGAVPLPLRIGMQRVLEPRDGE